MIVQATLSDEEAATIRNAASAARLTMEEYIRAAALLYTRIARDPYFRR
jgi:hypothetical protein